MKNSARVLLTIVLLFPLQVIAQTDLQKQEFFEAKIRPVLIEHCYKCHNSHGTKEGDPGSTIMCGLEWGMGDMRRRWGQHNVQDNKTNPT